MGVQASTAVSVTSDYIPGLGAHEKWLAGCPPRSGAAASVDQGPGLLLTWAMCLTTVPPCLHL